MKPVLLLSLAVFLLVSLSYGAPLGPYQHGTVVRMRMGDCMLMHNPFMTAFGPPQQQPSEGSCPEYTLLSDKVVFIIVGKSSGQLVPLAETVDFRFRDKELAVRVDDARKESKFAIKEMTLRSEWEMIQKHIEQRLNTPPREPEEASFQLRTRQ